MTCLEGVAVAKIEGMSDTTERTTITLGLLVKMIGWVAAIVISVGYGLTLYYQIQAKIQTIRDTYVSKDELSVHSAKVHDGAALKSDLDHQTDLFIAKVDEIKESIFELKIAVTKQANGSD